MVLNIINSNATYIGNAYSLTTFCAKKYVIQNPGKGYITCRVMYQRLLNILKMRNISSKDPPFC